MSRPLLDSQNITVAYDPYGSFALEKLVDTACLKAYTVTSKRVPIAYTIEGGDPLSLHSAYLTARQLDVWDLMRRGFTQSDIARKLNISRQAVNQLAQSIPEKVEAALYDASRLNGVDPKVIDSARGILLGWSKELQTETIITVNRRIGLRVWYHHHLGKCKICPDKKQCQSLLLEHASEYGISLTKPERALNPSKLAGIIFSKVLGPYDLKSQAIREKPTDRTLTRT